MFPRKAVLSAAVFALSSVAACTKSEAPAPKPVQENAQPAKMAEAPRAPAALSAAKNDFRSGTFPTGCGEADGKVREVPLKDGSWSLTDADENTYTFDVQRVLHEDLTGDGVAEAVVTTTCQQSGTGPAFAEVVVFTNRDAKIVPLARIDGGAWGGEDEPPIASVNSRVLTVRSTQKELPQKAEDYKTVRYGWNGKELAEKQE